MLLGRVSVADIFLILGSTGEGDDSTEWIVCVYQNENKADLHVTAATQWLRENNLSQDSTIVADWATRDKVVTDRANPFDEHFQCDYNGTRYRVQKLAVRKAAPVWRHELKETAA